MLQKALIIGKVWPEPNSSAAGSRMLQIIQVLKNQNWEVCFASAASDSAFMCDLNSLGVKKHKILLNDSSFDTFIKDVSPDLVLFDRFTTEEQFGWRVSENSPNAIRVLDTEDLHCLRAARQLAVKEKRTFINEDLSNAIAKREIAAIYRCDLSLIISEFEMNLLITYFKVAPNLLLHIPFMLEPLKEEAIQKWPAFNLRKNFISIGNFLHEPNWDAVQYLKKDIWPLIRKHLPKVEVHVYGAYPSHKVFELNNPKEGFLIKGRAESVSEVMMQSKVCLAPLRFGAGLKGKLIDSMIYGTPNVTTTVGEESMHGSLAWNGIVANTPEDFAKAAVELYSNQELWLASQKNGMAILTNLYTKQEHEHKLISTLQNIYSNLKTHRLTNFIGSMLMQDTTQSSRYMALWIEAKNKNSQN